jgi:hypothetical protein
LDSNLGNEIMTKNNSKSKKKKDTLKNKKSEKIIESLETQDSINKAKFDNICQNFSEEIEILENRNKKYDCCNSKYSSSESVSSFKIKDTKNNDFFYSPDQNYYLNENPIICVNDIKENKILNYLDQQHNEHKFTKTSENTENLKITNFNKNYQSLPQSLTSDHNNFNLTVAGLLLDFSRMIKQEGSRPYYLINYILSNMYSCNNSAISLTPASKKILERIRNKISSNKFSCYDKFIMDLNSNVIFKNIQLYSQMDLSNSVFFNLFEKINNLFCEGSIFNKKKKSSGKTDKFNDFEFDSKNWEKIDTVCVDREGSKNANLNPGINSKDCQIKQRFSYQNYVVKDLKKKFEILNFNESKFNDVNINKNLPSFVHTEILFNLLKDRKLFLSLIYLANRNNKSIFSKNLIDPSFESSLSDKLSSLFSGSFTTPEFVKNLKFKNSNLLQIVFDNIEDFGNLINNSISDTHSVLLTHKLKKNKILKVLKKLIKFEEMPEEFEGNKVKLYKKMWTFFLIFLNMKILQNKDTKIGSSFSDGSYFFKILVEFIKKNKEIKLTDKNLASSEQQVNCNKLKFKLDRKINKKLKNFSKIIINKDNQYNCIMKNDEESFTHKIENFEDRTYLEKDTSENLNPPKQNMNIIKIDKSAFQDLDLLLKNDKISKNKSSTDSIDQLDYSKNPLTLGLNNLNDSIQNSINNLNNLEAIKNFNVNLNLNLNVNLNLHLSSHKQQEQKNYLNTNFFSSSNQNKISKDQLYNLQNHINEKLTLKTNISDKKYKNSPANPEENLNNLNLIKRKRGRPKNCKDSIINIQNFNTSSNTHLDQKITQLEKIKSKTVNKDKEKLCEFKSNEENYKINNNSIIKIDFSHLESINNMSCQGNTSNLCFNSENKINTILSEKKLPVNIQSAYSVPQNESIIKLNLPTEKIEKNYQFNQNSQITQISQLLPSQFNKNNLNNNLNMKNILENEVDEDRTITTESDESHYDQPQPISELKKGILVDSQISNKFEENRKLENFDKIRQDTLSSFSSKLPPINENGTLNNYQIKSEKNSHGITEKFLNKTKNSSRRSRDSKNNKIFLVTKLMRRSGVNTINNFLNDFNDFNELNQIKSTIGNSLSIKEIKNLKKNLTSKKSSFNLDMMNLDNISNEENLPHPENPENTEYPDNPQHIQNFNNLISTSLSAQKNYASLQLIPSKDHCNLFNDKEIYRELEPSNNKNENLLNFDRNSNYNNGNYLNQIQVSDVINSKNVSKGIYNNFSTKTNNDLNNITNLKDLKKDESNINNNIYTALNNNQGSCSSLNILVSGVNCDFQSQKNNAPLQQSSNSSAGLFLAKKKDSNRSIISKVSRKSNISLTESLTSKINRKLLELKPVSNVNFEIIKSDKKRTDHCIDEPFDNADLNLFNDFNDEASRYFDF